MDDIEINTYKVDSLDILRTELFTASRGAEDRLRDSENTSTSACVTCSLRELGEHALDIAMTESLVYEPSQRFRYKQKTIRCQYCLGKRNLGSLQHQTRRFRWGVRPVKR